MRLNRFSRAPACGHTGLGRSPGCAAVQEAGGEGGRALRGSSGSPLAPPGGGRPAEGGEARP